MGLERKRFLETAGFGQPREICRAKMAVCSLTGIAVRIKPLKKEREHEVRA